MSMTKWMGVGKRIKQAVILAGGLGTRLMPLTKNKPKPMVLVNNSPFLEYLIDLLKDNGIQVESGVFGAHMHVNLINDGPVTILIDTRDM